MQSFGYMLCIIFAASLPLSSDRPPAQVMQAEIRVSLRYPDSVPIPGFVFRIIDGNSIVEAVTDQSGMAVFTLKADPTRCVQLATGDGTMLGWDDERLATYVSFAQALRQQFYMQELFWKPARRTLRVSLDATHSVVIDLERATMIQGRFIADSVQVAVGDVSCFARISNHGIARVPSSGRFALGGLPRNRDNELYFKTYPRVLGVPIGKEELASERADVGDVRVDITMEPESKLELSCVGIAEASDSLGYTVYPGITLIRDDGKVIYSLYGLPDGQLAVHPQGGTDLCLVDGIYYAAPGEFDGSTVQLALLDALRGAKIKADSQIPSISTKNPATWKPPIDAAGAASAILAELMKQDEE